MPFGKHAGLDITELPDAYVGWLCHVDWLKDPLKSQIAREQQRRHAGDAPPRRRPEAPRLLDQAAPIDHDLGRALIDLGEREVLRRRIDPGDDDREAVLRATADWLRDQLARRSP